MELLLIIVVSNIPNPFGTRLRIVFTSATSKRIEEVEMHKRWDCGDDDTNSHFESTHIVRRYARGLQHV